MNAPRKIFYRNAEVCPQCGAAESFRKGARGSQSKMADAELRRRLGENAREFCAEHFSRARILDKWEALLRETVKCANRAKA